MWWSSRYNFPKRREKEKQSLLVGLFFCPDSCVSDCENLCYNRKVKEEIISHKNKKDAVFNAKYIGGFQS